MGPCEVDHLFMTMSKLAPALCIGRNYGDKVSNADVRHSFNIVVVLTKDFSHDNLIVTKDHICSILIKLDCILYPN